MTLFLIVLVMVISNDTAQLVGNNTPPVLLWSSPDDLLAAQRNKDLMAVWARYPNINDPLELEGVINDLFREHGDNFGYSFWRYRTSWVDTLFDRTKF